MIFGFTITIASVLVLWSLGHCACAFFFSTRIAGRRVAGHRDHGQSESNKKHSLYRPKVSVLMSLRGCDPTLEKNLAGLLDQTYDDYEIIVIIDHRSDAAWQVVESVKAEFDLDNRLKYFELESPVDTCSLKCNSMIQATRHMNPESDVMVLVDSDIVPHRTWIDDAIAPLADPTVGVVSGNKWYSPADPSVGSLMRSLWNAGSLVPSAIYANPWAGSCAMRVDDVMKSGLVEIWETSVVDDGPIKAAFEPLNLKIQFEPRLIMINRDTCTTAFVSKYVTRMLTWSRMYERTFVFTVIHMFAMISILLSGIATLVVALVTADWSSAGILAGSMLAANLIMMFSYLTVRQGVSRVTADRSEHLQSMSAFKLLKLFFLLPVCQLAHGVWTISAILSRRVCWREITYQVHSRQRVEMVKYKPYSINCEARTPSRVSI